MTPLDPSHRWYEKVIHQAKSNGLDVVIEGIHEVFTRTVLFDGEGIEAKAEAREETLSYSILGASFFQSQPPAAEVCQRLQYALDRAWERVEQKNPTDEALIEAFIGHMIAIIPYAYPALDTSFYIPMKIGEKWTQCRYRVTEKLELTPEFLASPTIAYSLQSENELHPPLLVFLGTTYPGREGFLATLLTDATPFHSVGKGAYWFGKEKISAWFAKNKQVRIYGMSLGGTMAFHTLCNHEEKIDSVHVFNPPGLYPWEWRKRYDSFPIKIYYHERDMIGLTGYFPVGERVEVIRILKEERKSVFAAHTQVYTASYDEQSKRVLMLKSNVGYEHSRLSRLIMTIIHLIASLFLFLPFLLITCLVSTVAFAYTKINEKLSHADSVFPSSR